MVVDNPRQHGHLHQPEADDDRRGNRRPLRAADGFSRKLISICRFVNETFEHRQENDFDIEPDAPFADVLRLNSTRFSIFSSVSVSPRQPLICSAGNARFHFVAQHVAFNELAILSLCVLRADMNRQSTSPVSTLINCGSSSSEVRRRNSPFGDARIVLRRLSHHFVVLHHFHGTELPHFDWLAIHAIASLAENNQPR